MQCDLEHVNLFKCKGLPFMFEEGQRPEVDGKEAG